VRYLVGRVAGIFNDWGGTVVLDPGDLSGGKVEVTVQTLSTNTLNSDRDSHLRTPDFFAADSFPTMSFRSDRVEVMGTQVKVYGDLTLRGVTKSVILNGVYLGGIARGDLYTESDDLRRLTGRPTTPWREAVAAAVRGG
jgi:polyisoprenoid-binding protein YceI